MGTKWLRRAVTVAILVAGYYLFRDICVERYLLTAGYCYAHGMFGFFMALAAVGAAWLANNVIKELWGE